MNISNTVWGFLFALVMVVAAAPQLIDFLPPGAKTTVTGICGLLAALFVFMGFKKSKDTSQDS